MLCLSLPPAQNYHQLLLGLLHIYHNPQKIYRYHYRHCHCIVIVLVIFRSLLCILVRLFVIVIVINRIYPPLTTMCLCHTSSRGGNPLSGVKCQIHRGLSPGDSRAFAWYTLVARVLPCQYDIFTHTHTIFSYIFSIWVTCLATSYGSHPPPPYGGRCHARSA